MLLAARASTGIPASSSACSAPTWAMPRAPPPERARARRGRGRSAVASAASGSICAGRRWPPGRGLRGRCSSPVRFSRDRPSRGASGRRPPRRRDHSSTVRGPSNQEAPIRGPRPGEGERDLVHERAIIQRCVSTPPGKSSSTRRAGWSTRSPPASRASGWPTRRARPWPTRASSWPCPSCSWWSGSGTRARALSSTRSSVRGSSRRG